MSKILSGFLDWILTLQLVFKVSFYAESNFPKVIVLEAFLLFLSLIDNNAVSLFSLQKLYLPGIGTIG